MKCEVHPEQEAVGTCVACGRGICPVCKMVYGGRLYCKSCIEAGRAQMPYQYPYQQQQGAPGAQQPAYPYYGYGYAYPYYMPPPRIPTKPSPTGEPKKGFYLWGIAGSSLLALCAVIFGVLLMVFWFRSGISVLNWIMAGGVTVCTCFLAFGCYGLYRNLGMRFGLVAAVGMTALAFMFIITYFWLSNMMSYDDWYDGAYSPMTVVYLMALAMAGISFFAGAVALIVQQYLQKTGTATAAGVVLIIAGALLAALVGVFIIGWVLFAIGCFMLASVFYQAPMPGQDGYERQQGTAQQHGQYPGSNNPGPTATAVPPAAAGHANHGHGPPEAVANPYAGDGNRPLPTHSRTPVTDESSAQVQRSNATNELATRRPPSMDD